MSIPHVAAAVFGRPWFLTPEAMSTIAEVVGLRHAGVRLSSEAIEERLRVAAAAAGPRSGARVSGAVGVIPVYGTLFHRANLMTEFSGGATYEGLTRAFREALADEAVGSILLEFDSPGGEVAGCDVLAAEIRAARGRKPIVAVANTLMASAAYYLAAQADEIVAAPWAIVGSIGTVLTHQEFSRAEDAEGVTTTIVRRPDSKAAVNDHEPLTDDARSTLQTIVDDAYGQFVNAVAKGRGVSPAAVRNGYGQGDVLTAQRALEAGMVDRVDTVENTLRRLAGGRVKSAAASSEADLIEVDAGPVSVTETTHVVEGDSGFMEAVVAQFEVPDAEDAARRARLELDQDAWFFGS